jgi:nucleotide-binding universal stress UspA family protein
MQRIVVGTDGSPGAERAVDMAIRLAAATGGQLFMVYAGGNYGPEEVRELIRAEGSKGDVLETLSQRVLDDACARAKRQHVAATADANWGDAARCILDTAARHDADLIVVGRRGYGQLAGLLVGSVSQKLVSLAKCPVLVVP